jgi:lipid-A-disaccharide synthase-like uncharacterized protein
MTTLDTVMAWSGKALQRTAERRAHRQKVNRNILQVLWALFTLVGGLSCFVYAAWRMSDTSGIATAGVSLFVLRTMIDWRSDESS